MQFHRTLLLSLTLSWQVFVLIVRKGTSSQWWELKNFPMCVSKTPFQQCHPTRFSGATFSTTLGKRPGDCPCWFVDWLNLGDFISTSCRVNENSHLQPVFLSLSFLLSVCISQQLLMASCCWTIESTPLLRSPSSRFYQTIKNLNKQVLATKFFFRFSTDPTLQKILRLHGWSWKR